MAVTINGGAGGGGGTPGVAVPGEHPTTGEVLYSLDNSIANTGAGTYANLGGSLIRGPGHRSDLESHNTKGTNGLSVAASGTPIKTTGAFTCAFWVFFKAAPAANTALVGLRDTGSGSAFNFPWTVDIGTAGQIRVFWQSGSKVARGIGYSVATDLTENQWVHVMATRSADGADAYLWLDGVLADSVTGETPADGGGSIGTLRICNNGTGDQPDCFISQVYVDDSYTADGAAFYAAAKQVQT